MNNKLYLLLSQSTVELVIASCQRRFMMVKKLYIFLKNIFCICTYSDNHLSNMSYLLGLVSSVSLFFEILLLYFTTYFEFLNVDKIKMMGRCH